MDANTEVTGTLPSLEQLVRNGIHNGHISRNTGRVKQSGTRDKDWGIIITAVTHQERETDLGVLQHSRKPGGNTAM